MFLIRTFSPIFQNFAAHFEMLKQAKKIFQQLQNKFETPLADTRKHALVETVSLLLFSTRSYTPSIPLEVASPRLEHSEYHNFYFQTYQRITVLLFYFWNRHLRTQFWRRLEYLAVSDSCIML